MKKNLLILGLFLLSLLGHAQNIKRPEVKALHRLSTDSLLVVQNDTIYPDSLAYFQWVDDSIRFRKISGEYGDWYNLKAFLNLLETDNEWNGENSFNQELSAHYLILKGSIVPGTIQVDEAPSGQDAQPLVLNAGYTTELGYKGGSIFLQAGQGSSENGNVYLSAGWGLGSDFGSIHLGTDMPGTYPQDTYAKTQNTGDDSDKVATTKYVDSIFVTDNNFSGDQEYTGLIKMPNLLDGVGDFVTKDVDGFLRKRLASSVFDDINAPGLFPYGGVLFAANDGSIVNYASKFFWDYSSYRLGIGTKTPAGYLHIHGGASNTNLYATTSTSTYVPAMWLGVNYPTSSKWTGFGHKNGFNISVTGSFNTPSLFIDYSGNISLGGTAVLSSPTMKILTNGYVTINGAAQTVSGLNVTGGGHFSGTMYVGSWGSTAGGQFVTQVGSILQSRTPSEAISDLGGKSAFNYWTNNGSYLYWDNAVAINTTDPGIYKLWVQGIVRITDVITTTNEGTSTNWKEAYDWGDHSLEGYLTSFSEVDPIFTSSDVFGVTTADITNWNLAHGWGDHSLAGYLTSFTETDPIFTAHDAFAVTSVKIINWDNAFGWGDHTGLYEDAISGKANGFLTWDTDHWVWDLSSYALAVHSHSAYEPGLGNPSVDGYILSSTTAGVRSWIAPPSGGSMDYPDAGIALSNGSGWETSITNNSANWNSAFSWGDHSGLYEDAISGKANGFLTWDTDHWVWDLTTYALSSHSHSLYAPLASPTFTGVVNSGTINISTGNKLLLNSIEYFLPQSLATNTVSAWQADDSRGVTRKAIESFLAANYSTGGGTPGGSDTQIQYNNGSAFGGMTGLTYDDSDHSTKLVDTYNFHFGNNSYTYGTASSLKRTSVFYNQWVWSENDDSFEYPAITWDFTHSTLKFSALLDQDWEIQNSSGNLLALFPRSTTGTVKLYYNNTKVAEILSAKLGVTGQVQASGNISSTGGEVTAATGFTAGASAGITTTFIDNNGNTITVTGGIVTGKEAPAPMPKPVPPTDIDQYYQSIEAGLTFTERIITYSTDGMFWKWTYKTYEMGQLTHVHSGEDHRRTLIHKLLYKNN